MNIAWFRKKLLIGRRRRASRMDWRRRHAKVFALHPELKAPRSSRAEQEHRALWQPFGARFSLDTYRLCANLSGNDDPRYVPEELFVSELQEYLYPGPYVRFLADKNVYDRWFGSFNPASCFPKTYLRKVCGAMHRPDYSRLKVNEVRTIAAELPYPVVCKPALGSFGGRGIAFCEAERALMRALDSSTDLVVQERIRPHSFFAQFGEVGLNTIRVYCYRAGTTGQIEILNTALRMGVDGSLDNETAGGIVCHLNESGELNAYALDKYAGVYHEHPDRRIVFKGLAIPNPEGLYSLATALASWVLGGRLVGLDMCMDSDGQWRCLEINLGIQTIRFAQYAGRPFFGEHTTEVIDAARQEQNE